MVKAVIGDDEENIMTPCRYGIQRSEVLEGRKIPPSEIISFRGRFCEQAHRGDKVVARGLLEKVVGKEEEIFQIVIGENPADYLKLVEYPS
jgi:Uncharacterized protein conserved in archaea